MTLINPKIGHFCVKGRGVGVSGRLQKVGCDRQQRLVLVFSRGPGERDGA